MKEKIKNILCKKPIKILLRVIGVFSTFFTIFIILIFVLGSCSKHDYENIEQHYNIVENTKDKQINKNAVELNNGGYLYNLMEFVNRFIESPKRVDEFRNLSVNEYIVYNGLFNYLYANKDNMNMGVGNFSIDGVNIGSILGQVLSDDYYWYNSTLLVRDIGYNFYSTPTPDANNVIFSIHVGYIKTSMAQLEQWSYTQVQVDSIDRLYFVYDSNANGDVLGLRMSQYGDYKLGYDTGYNAGWSNGYDTGYNAGSIGIANNPFTLIKTGFDSIASLLNIELFPNVTLGLLMFTPLVVIIVIALVRMFKG